LADLKAIEARIWSLLEGTPEALVKRRTGKAAFNFPNLDEDLARALEALLSRLYERYRADHAGG